MFGLKQEDIAMQSLIASYGYTVAEAAELRKQDKLPPELNEAWDKYAEWLSNCYVPNNE